MKDASPDEEGVIPPPGYVLAQDENGNRFWVHPDSVSHGERELSELTDEQIERARATYEVFKEVLTIPVEDHIKNFRKDEEPEAELRIWEGMGRIYQLECQDRPGADKKERTLLFKVLLAFTMTNTVEALISMRPSAKSLSNLDRVIARCEAV